MSRIKRPPATISVLQTTSGRQFNCVNLATEIEDLWANCCHQGADGLIGITVITDLPSGQPGIVDLMISAGSIETIIDYTTLRESV